MLGKDKCKMLKEIRHKIADNYGIPYDSTPCIYDGEDCLGTCNKCDAETASMFNYIIEHGIKLSDEDFVDVITNADETMPNDSFSEIIESRGQVHLIMPKNHVVGHVLPIDNNQQVSGYNPFNVHTDYIPSFEDREEEESEQ